MNNLEKNILYTPFVDIGVEICSVLFLLFSILKYLSWNSKS